nr:hypothetical protein B0A51_04777 [Rachicladosporium sp. CCFEE 5018]
MRSLCGAIFPLFGSYMFEGIGIQWGMTLLGCVAALFIPMPFLFYFKGRSIRAKSKFAPALDIQQDKRRDEEARIAGDAAEDGRLLRLGAEVDTRGKPRRNGTALHHAAAAGHFGMVELLLKNGGYAEVCGANGYKPLLLALLVRHEEIAIFLFGKMGDPDSQIAGEAGYTSLHAACLRQLPKSAPVFLESGANVNVRTSKGNTPLHLALKREASDESNNTIRTCTLELVMLLLEFGSDRDTKAHSLGLQHPDPRVRGIFQEHRSSSPQRASFISIGRRWSVQDSSNADCFFSPVSATFSPSWNRQSADASGKDNLPTIVAENLFDDEVFPVLGSSRLWQEQEPSTSAWSYSNCSL